MITPSVQDAPASTASPAASSFAMPQSFAPPPPSGAYQAPIRHMLFGSLRAVQSTIRVLHKRGYAEPNDWSQPMSTGRPNEVMAILTKRVKVNS